MAKKNTASGGKLREHVRAYLELHAGKAYSADSIMRALERQNVRFARDTLDRVLTEFRMAKTTHGMLREQDGEHSRSPQEKLAARIVTALSKVETDSVMLHVRNHRAPLVRIDKVWDSEASLWLSLWLSDREESGSSDLSVGS